MEHLATPLKEVRPIARRVHPALAAALILLLSALFSAWYLGSSPRNSEWSFGLGAISRPHLKGFHDAETSATGEGFRWSDGAGVITLPAQGSGPHLLTLALSAPRPNQSASPVPVTLSWDGAPLLEAPQGPEPRIFRLLVPAAAVRWGDNHLGIASPSFRPAAQVGDERKLGVVVFHVGWRSVETTWWLPLAQAAVIGGATVALALLLRRAGIPTVANAITLALFVAILLAMRHTDLRFTQRWDALLLTGGLGLLAGAALPAIRPQPGDGPLPWRAWAEQHWLALLGYVALTAVMLWPILAHLTTQIPGHPGDAFEYIWKLQLFSDYLVGRHQSPTFLPDLMYPEGFELAHSEITPANTLLGLPFTWLLGPTASFNLLNLASYVLSGFFCYLLIHRLGARRSAAFVGALVFAFTVRRFYQMSSGHLPLMPTQYLPLALYGLEGMLTRRRNWDALVTSVALAQATWASLYYGTTFALFLAGYALLRLGLRPCVGWLAAAWRPIVVAAVVLLALATPFGQPYLEIREQGSSLKHELGQLAVHSARLGDYLLPNPNHPLWGQWARDLHRNDGGEHVVDLGFSTVALAALGLLLARPRRLAVAMAILMAVFFVLSLGPLLYLPGHTPLPLPVLFIYDHVPVLDGIRVWNRVILYVVLCCAILAGLALTRAPGRRAYAVSALAAVVLLVELASVSRFTAAAPRAVDRWLAAQPDSRASIELPTNLSGSDVFFASFQGRPSSEWYGTFNPPLYAENIGVLNNFPSPQSLAVIRRWGLGYLIVGEGSLAKRKPDWEAAIAELPGLEEVYRAEGYRVYAVH